MKIARSELPRDRGFALVVTLSLMVLLTLIAVGLLSLSAISLRSSSRGMAQTEARANARLALMLAIGELQKEMGPDMRVSAKAALFDLDASTEAIEGVNQPNWLASYESWGSWLNASYKNPASGMSLNIRDTYTPKREKMFRRWLLSLPVGMSGNIDAPLNLSGWDDTNSVVLVGQGSLGATAGTRPEQVTRAYLNSINGQGRSAWWIGPENHKARIDMAKQPRELTAASWETSHGDTAEVGAGILPGLGVLDSDKSLGDKLITRQSLRPAGVAADVVGSHFFDLTATSRGVLASVRTGSLKKDLSLLFEQDKANLPAPYKFTTGDVREPSIRPMSPEIATKAVLPGRHFAPWNRMRHFYRMYRQNSDAMALPYASGGTDGRPGLDWIGSKPWTKCNFPIYGSAWSGQDTYQRFPIVTNITYILSLQTQRVPSGTYAGKYILRYVATPVFMLWNPYNVELRMPDNKLIHRSYLMQVQTLLGKFSTVSSSNPSLILDFDDDYATFKSGNSGDITFKPGELRIFSQKGANLFSNNALELLPGFDPQSFGGLYQPIGGYYTPTDNPKFEITFCANTSPNPPGGNLFNSHYGNTPGSFVSVGMWSSTSTSLPFDIALDWLKHQRKPTRPLQRLGSRFLGYLTTSFFPSDTFNWLSREFMTGSGTTITQPLAGRGTGAVAAGSKPRLTFPGKPSICRTTTSSATHKGSTVHLM